MPHLEDIPPLSRGGWPQDHPRDRAPHSAQNATLARRKRLIARIATTLGLIVVVLLCAKFYWETSVDLATREAVGRWFEDLWGTSDDGTLGGGL